MAPASLRLRWNEIGKTPKAIACVALTAAAAAAFVAAIGAHSPVAPLFAAPLHADQLEEIEERLAAWNVPFTPTADNVEVDSRRRNELLLRLSLAGVPRGHLTGESEALSSIGALTPQAVIDEQTLTGREGDIAAAIRSVAGIEDARVIIAPAKNAEFADDSASDASASVWLRLAPGDALSRDTVAGIRAFVAAAVSGLQPARVAILDDGGSPLGAASAAGGAASPLETALQSALDAAFGAGMTIVRVHEEYAQQSVERHDVTRLPAGGTPIDATASSRSYEHNGERYRERSEQSSRGTQTRELTSSQAAGALERISTAVFVDASHAGDLLAIRDLAAATVGYDPQRGDALAVQSVEFARTPPIQKNLWWLAYGSIVPTLPIALLVLGALVALRLSLPSLNGAVSTLSERVRVAEAVRRAPEMPADRVHRLLASEPPHAAAVVISALPAATAAAVLELYPAHERSAIVQRMHRTTPPLVPNPAELLRDA
jgi:flagellar M-ring protein FliF